jgi:nitrile hydratase alpha subunit
MTHAHEGHRADHDDSHHHDPHAPIEDQGTPRPESQALERALRELLIEKGVFSAEDIRRQIELTESRTPALGAKVVARAWVDADFRRRLLADAKGAIQSFLGIDLNHTPELVVVANTDERHHVICCTLCSCYPRAVLGIPPAWYKSREYRSRLVAEPRAVLAEFGTSLPDGIEVRVVDSTADVRYMVLPRRPAGTEGLSEEALAALVTRDSMVGVSLALEPDTHAAS